MTPPAQPHPLILASASPRRAELLQEAGFRFSVIPSPEEEPPLAASHGDPPRLATAIALFKARAVAVLYPSATVLGADTIAEVGGEIIGKPSDRADAGRIIRRLSGTIHRVITGVALVGHGSGRTVARHDVSVIHIRALSDAEIEAYLDTGAWEGKAGAYGIQDHGDAFVERYEGSFTNIVGLPLETVKAMLAEWAVDL